MAAVANNRIENSRQVVFDKDYAKAGKVIYRKGETHYIHKKVVEKAGLAKFGKVTEIDFKAEVVKAKKVLGIVN